MLQPVTISDQNPTVFEGVIFPEGEFTVVAHATDFWGNVAVSAPVSFTVSDGPPGGEDESESESSTSESGGEGESDSGEDESSSEGGFDEVGDTFGQSDEGSTSSCAVVDTSGGAGWGLLGLALLGLGLGLRRRD
ncbi:MAG: hypothetical protein HC927_12480 [Deltaproteobacteria bacterium]|nr:hypothetical protein [Deltaproteobacteria bacterium]